MLLCITNQNTKSFHKDLSLFDDFVLAYNKTKEIFLCVNKPQLTHYNQIDSCSRKAKIFLNMKLYNMMTQNICISSSLIMACFVSTSLTLKFLRINYMYKVTLFQ